VIDTGRRWGSRRRWGYFVWLVAGAVIAVPEIAAAIDRHHRWLQFTTISEMVGHLERHHTWVELLVVAAIVFAAFSVVKLSPRTESGTEGPVDDPDKAQRTAGGRLTVVPSAVTTQPEHFDDQGAPVLFAVASAVSLAAIALGTLAAVEWWQDERHFHPSYVLYGSLALLWVVIPSLYAFFSGNDTPFPTLFRSVVNLEEWLRSRTWMLGKLALGPVLGWIVVYVIAAGLVILLLHLTLYPYPDITKILNPRG
jgi:membrane protein implicated in regulation of membrane protease activity